MSSQLGWCAAEDDESGKRCPCRAYREAEIPDPDRPIRCLECFHGRSLHIKPNENLAIDNSAPSQASSVTSILRRLTGSDTFGTKSSTVDAARLETNEGLKRFKNTNLAMKGKIKKVNDLPIALCKAPEFFWPREKQRKLATKHFSRYWL